MKFLSFGSVNHDIVYSVKHIVQEGETISCQTMQKFWGGKGQNQCVALARSGAPTSLAARISEDDASMLSQLAHNCQINVESVGLDKTPTGHAIIQVNDDGQNAIIVYPGANYSMSPDFIDQVLEKFSAGDILLLQNEINNIPYIIKAAKKIGMIVALNPSPFTKEILHWPLELVDLFVLNEIECEAFCGAADAEVMRKKYPHAEIVLTLGGNGSVFCGNQGLFHQDIFKVPVVDTTAAGDTFTGYFLNTYYTTGDAKAALRIASKAAAIAVSRNGAVPSIPHADEVASGLLSCEG